MRLPYDVDHSNPQLDHDEDLRELITLAASSLSSASSSSSTSTALTLADFLLSPYVLLSYSLRSIVLTLHALLPPEAHFHARLDILVPIFVQHARLLASSGAEEEDPFNGAHDPPASVHFAQARVAVILTALQLPYLGAHFAAQPFSNLIEVTTEQARSQAQQASSLLPEKSLGPVRPLLEALYPPDGNNRIQDLSTATPFEIILHGRVVSHPQELDPHEFQTLHESRARTALRILADATTQPVGLRDSRTINELLAELDFLEVLYSPACLAFPALAARNPNTAIQVLSRLCDLTNNVANQRPSDALALPDLLDELAHALDPSSLRSLDLVIRLVRDQTPATFALALSEISSPNQPPPRLPSHLGVLTQLVLLGPFLHRCMARLSRAYSPGNNWSSPGQARRRTANSIIGDSDPNHDEAQEARVHRIETRVQQALANLWNCTGILDARIVEGAVPVLMADASISKWGKSKADASGSARVVLPYNLDPSPHISDEVAWERELHNFCQLVRALLTSDTLLASPGPPSLTLPLEAQVEAALYAHSRSVAEAVRIELRQFMLEYGKYKAANEVHQLLAATAAEAG
ncbi:hypothetical protein OC835_004192 [Tilletia horrida]|uniref:Uncharacterized protein n=1 Tax=Tilletia horrida TaxID=155126 RepID=A0AAN6JL91_9BASI|nr:hypothetical protein OC835_004192 [Tilletia horrida]KAK0534811.1 hypothetical protein OC842_002524 [Tilletia horrida]